MAPLDPSEPYYEIGLALAGAATGGAYSAGVMDFFLEAMNTWEEEKKKKTPGVPTWTVRLAEVTGTSAGGITSALAVSALNTNHQPLPRNFNISQNPPANNGLYETWVERMTYERLFDTEDIDDIPKNEQTMKSILNSNFMKNNATEVMLKTSETIKKDVPFWASHVGLSLTTTNLRGVPYSVRDIVTNSNEEDFLFRKYADYSWYWATTHPSEVPADSRERVQILNLTNPRNSDMWKRAIISAQATSALPLFFPSVQVETPLSNYTDRIMGANPSWQGSKDKFVYTAVDGGILNNRPFGLLRENILREPEVSENGRPPAVSEDGTLNDSNFSIVMIDPFPPTDQDSGPGKNGLGIQPLLTGVVRAITGEAVFHEEDVQAIFDKENMARFMIRPERRGKDGSESALATARLQHFGGIIDKKIRLHDFQLGRRNCQKFLKETFVMRKATALKHEVFGKYSEFLDLDYDGTEKGYIPIIPVVGEAAKEQAVPEWPVWTGAESDQIIADIMAKVKPRLDGLTQILFWNMKIFKHAKWNIGKHLLNLTAETVRRIVLDEASDRFRDELEKAMKSFASA